MSVFRIEKTNKYTVMSNYHLKDINLSYKAKGLLSFMLSLPDYWDYSVKGITKVSKESIKAIRSILKELEDFGYLIRTRIQLDNGRFDYEYSIYEKPYTQKGNT
ncbi:MAG: helix-turn-helix domain-containing protein, partial [bacterium]|nr:helix-turn-helix domain-containing protein [bacterium]